MRIIVYGSLRRKQGNSHWMTNGQWLGDHQLEGYALYSLGHYPGIVAGEGQVYCEVYRIDASTLGELDALRTKGGEYKRELVRTPYGSAWLYVYQRSVTGMRRINSGDWLLRDAPDAD
ncbi:gamma-glutamylcyclotransferase [Erwinia sp. 9145]|uniref:gamma-glutamylcyclotransferase family protein n=1 Tax=Erwinia sp. 9145 TaxID=1500895 RepID=UPI00055127AF|nr:gamma-glutamylcyclotransferase [Erwinia sp. 9145]